MGWVGYGAIALVMAGTAAVQHNEQKQAERAAEQRAAADLNLRKELASQAKAPVVRKEGDIQLKSAEAKEDEEILARSKRNRLRVKRNVQSSSTASVGTGLSI